MMATAKELIAETDIEIRPFERSDLDEIMEIEEQSFSAPWSRQSYLELAPLSTIRFLVLKKNKKVIGYMLYQLWAEEMELHTIAIAPPLRGQGLSAKMMEYLLEDAKARQVQRVFLQVRPSNAAARHLYKKFGFNVVGIRHRYYRDNFEDALVMRRDVNR